jgi:MFS family permease
MFGGLLFDMIGSRNGIFLFTTILVCGQGLFMIGGYQSSYSLMLVGRILYGMGCESMYVGQSAIITEWFINFEMPFAIACGSCLPLFGSFIGGAVIPNVYS